MDWLDDVLAWLCKYGCVSNPGKEIRKMVQSKEYEDPGCTF